ncbi:ATPase, T2SS/T4P/T4SS family, partial [Streptomyces sp. P17]|uniref:ATPase, T2SS/T4P/T4SS family n=1 Tax=Streptomyces sp. P17 TaxID=3074716 RepID=UPI0028F45673
EIRDLESARIAAQAALTGHLILATLHTNDAPSAVTRLIDMGLEDYLLTATLNGVVAQRLVRSLCKTCRQSFEPDAQLIAGLNLLQLSGG